MGISASIWFKNLLIIVCVLILGCSTPSHPLDDLPKLPTHVDGATDYELIKAREKLINQGVRVISMGQNTLISIPSSLLFADQSPKLNWGSYGLLNDIACYLQKFRKISLHVSAYTSPYVSERRAHVLARTRARMVGNYLWSRGVNSRFIFTHGLGSDKPIVAFWKKGDQSVNSRIEITFRQAVG